MATPTGMALLTALSGETCDLPAMSVHRVGLGAGTRDVPGHPNVVRVVLGDRADLPAEPDGSQVMSVLETNVDDMDPRLWPTVLGSLLDAGAADAWLVPIVMKKGRPAHTLAVLTSVGNPPVAVGIVEQRREVGVAPDNDVAPTPAVSTIWTAHRQPIFAAKRRAP